MTKHNDADTSVEPGALDEQAATEEPIPPITSDWTPEVDDYRISTA